MTSRGNRLFVFGVAVSRFGPDRVVDQIRVYGGAWRGQARLVLWRPCVDQKSRTGRGGIEIDGTLDGDELNASYNSVPSETSCRPARDIQDDVPGSH